MLKQTGFAHCGLQTLVGLLLATLSHGNNNSQNSVLDQQVQCFRKTRADVLWQACTATYEPGYNDLPIWGVLINKTAECMPYNTEAANQTAYGTFWEINAQRAFVDFLERFNAATGLRVGFQSVPLHEFISNREPVWPTAEAPGSLDFQMVGAEVFGEGIAHDAFTDLTRLLDREDHYKFGDVPPALRFAVSSAFTGAYTALPFMVLPWPLLYRRDVFNTYGIAVPQTWDDVLLLAEWYDNNLRSDPGQPNLAFCFESNLACGNAHKALSYILASLVQVRGHSQGSWFDPEDLQPLYTTDAFREALRIFIALKQHSVGDDAPCRAVYDMLASGSCLMLWGSSFAFKRGSSASGPLRGRQGVASVPGSTLVLHRPTGRVVPCTPDLCPFATPATPFATATAGSSNGSNSSCNSTHTAMTTTCTTTPGKAVLINRVIPFESVSFTINAFAPLPRQAAAFALLHTFSSPLERLKVMLDPASDLGPLRSSELEESVWIGAGYEPNDVLPFLAESRQFFTHPNVYTELRIPIVFEVYALIQTLLQRSLWGNYTHEELMTYAATATQDIVRQAGGKDFLLPLYQKSIGYSQPSESVSAIQQSQKQKQHQVASVLAPSMAAILLAAVALWGYARYSRLQAVARAALSAAPGAGPATTLLVTDIQDSTVLWEALPAHVMDSAVKVHHRIIRELLLLHRGYESATEGDSFILAFEGPDRALAFALTSQEGLLRADWPQELTTCCRSAATLFVRCDAAACATVLPYICRTSRLRDVLLSALGAVISYGVTSGGGGGGGGGSGPSPLLSMTHCRSMDLILRSQEGNQNAASHQNWTFSGKAAEALLGTGRTGAGDHCKSFLRHDGDGDGDGGDVGDIGDGRGGGGAGGGGDRASPAEQISVQSANDLRRKMSGTTPQRLVPIFGMRRGSTGAGFAPTHPSRADGSAGAVRASTDQGYGASTTYGLCVSMDTVSTSAIGTRPSAVVMATAVAATELLSAEPYMLPPTAGAAAVLIGRESCCGSMCGEEAGLLGTSAVRGGGVAGGGRGGGSSCGTAATTSMDLREMLAQVFPLVPTSCEGATAIPLGGGGSILLFRGLRVRMGMHCGVLPKEVQYNSASSRTVYPGPSLQVAKAVSDAGRGGQILMSAAARAALLESKAGGAGAGVDMPYIVLNAGKHLLKESSPSTELYSYFSRDLLPRAGHMSGLRSLQEQVPSVLAAPLGRVAAALVHVQDADDFAGWGLEAALKSHRAMSKMAASLARLHGGYLLRTPLGSFQAVFTSPEAAIRWLLQLQDDLGPAPRTTLSPPPSPPSLSPLLQQCWTGSVTSSDNDIASAHLRRAAAVAQLSTFLLKGGVDVGPLTAALGADGEMSYSGRTVKRAACLTASAVWHEVLVSWEAAREVLRENHPAAAAAAVAAAPVLPTSRGPVPSLRGKYRRHPRVPFSSPSNSTNTCPDQASAKILIRHFETSPDLATGANSAIEAEARPSANAGGGAADRTMGHQAPAYRGRSSQSPAAGGAQPPAAATALAIGDRAFLGEPLAFSSGTRVVKFKGGFIEACAVMLGGRGGCGGAGGGGGGGGGGSTAPQRCWTSQPSGARTEDV